MTDPPVELPIRTLTDESDAPKHQQLREILEDVCINYLNPGDMLPGERVLEEQYGVSRITVRRAIGDLVASGKLRRARGQIRRSLAVRAERFARREFNGDRDEWPDKIDDALWQKVSNDNYGCLKSACPNRAECPFYLARDTLDNADVVVANHDLLMVDISMGGGVILPAPEHSFYCIDEAHHLPKKALNQFAAEHSLNQAVWALEKLPQITDKIAAVADKADLANLADEAAAALLDSISRAGETYWIYYNAAEPGDNEPRLPASPIQELLQYLDEQRADAPRHYHIPRPATPGPAPPGAPARCVSRAWGSGSTRG